MVMTKPACVLSLFLFAFFGSLTQGIAYEGGPIRAEVVGYDPTESKLFYRLVFHDETDDATQVYYLHLTGRDPARAIRARSLEHPFKSEIIPEVTSRWQQVSNRLVPLNKILEVKPALHVKAKGAGTDSSHQNVPRYKITVEVSAGAKKAEVQFTGFCRPLVRAQTLYQIPGRPELLSVLSYIGRAYGCEDVESPILLLEGGR